MLNTVSVRISEVVTCCTLHQCVQTGNARDYSTFVVVVNDSLRRLPFLCESVTSMHKYCIVIVLRSPKNQVIPTNCVWRRFGKGEACDEVLVLFLLLLLFYSSFILFSAYY